MHPTLTFLGAAGSVTGSRFLVESGTERTLVDAGLYQGLRELRRRNWDPFPLAPALLDAVVLTHAHLDHTGYLPCLVRDGFSGPVVCTPRTASLTEIVLRDSAHLQEEDARNANAAGWSKHPPALPLYSAKDAEGALRLLHPLPFHERLRLGESTAVELRRAGHILGSAVAALTVGEERVVFSGDLGRRRPRLLRPPEPPPAASTVVIESTYGNRPHAAPDASVLAGAVTRTIARGGVVLIPAFAVDRTELVLLELLRLRRHGAIPDVPVFVDSPMALDALDVYRAAAVEADDILPSQASALAELDRLDVHRVRDADGSERLNRPRRPCIVISASGMATGGRVLHHLAHLLPDSHNCVVLTGYQAAGSRGRQLQEGARHLKMHGRYVAVRAEVVDVRDFSVHADAGELLGWLAAAPAPPRTVYVVHGEPDASATLARRIEDELGLCAVVPVLGERVRLD